MNSWNSFLKSGDAAGASSSLLPHADHHSHLRASGQGANGDTGLQLLPSLPFRIPSSMHGATASYTSALHQHLANNNPQV